MHAQQTQFSTQQESWTAQIKKKRLHKKDFYFGQNLKLKKNRTKNLQEKEEHFQRKKTQE